MTGKMLGKIARRQGACGYGCCTTWNPTKKGDRKHSRKAQRSRERQAWQREVTV